MSNASKKQESEYMTSKRDPWQREPGVHDIERNGRAFKNLVLFTRECVTCKARFGIYVTQRVADGYGSNNNFGLKNCELHRSGQVGKAELEAMRTANATMKEELAGLYERVRLLFEELQQTKARLAQYELGPATFTHVVTLPDAPARSSGLTSKPPWL